MYINKIEVIEDFNPLKVGLKIEIKKPICFLVGDNAIGKSTVLDCLAAHYKFPDETLFKRRDAHKFIKVEDEENIKVKYIDFHGHDRKFSGHFGDDMMLQMQQMRASSGQVNITLMNQLGSFSDGLILLDEPERGLSIRNQFKTSKILYGLSTQKNCQFIVTSHSDIILKTFKYTAQYFSIQDNIDITYEDFILQQSLI